MLDDLTNTQNSDQTQVQEAPQMKTPPPPQGDSEKAEKYISQLIDLIKADKILVSHTDLNKFNLDSLQDHYFIQLSDYEIEVSHSKSADTDQDFYVILFNNIKKVKEGCSEKIILAYIHMDKSHFDDFKQAADEQIEKKRKELEAKRFTEALSPIDSLLENLSSQSSPQPEENSPSPSADSSDSEQPYTPKPLVS